MGSSSSHCKWALWWWLELEETAGCVLMPKTILLPLLISILSSCCPQRTPSYPPLSSFHPECFSLVNFQQHHPQSKLLLLPFQSTVHS